MTGCNADWLREEAGTTLIMVSDEAEQSADDPDLMVADILAIAPNAVIHSIVGDVPDGCATASAGTGYDVASVLTGGVFLSICDADWGEYFRTIAERSASNQTDTFSLSAWPAPATLEVTVNGFPVGDWTYDADRNAVVFYEDYWPPPSATVVVTYSIAAECL